MKTYNKKNVFQEALFPWFFETVLSDEKNAGLQSKQNAISISSITEVRGGW